MPHAYAALILIYINENIITIYNYGLWTDEDNLHVVVNEKVEAVEVEVSDTRFESMFDGVETVQHNVLHATLYHTINQSFIH